MANIVEIAKEKVVPVIEKLGYEVVDVEYLKKGETFNLTFYIDIMRGVTLDDCEKVHNEIDPVLDALDPTAGAPYTLNVSSPGLDRPFKKQRDYERNYGREVEIKLFGPLKGKKVFEGVLISRNENTITIKTDKEEITIENNRVAKVCPLVKFE